MQAFIVTAHPNIHSFTFALADDSAATLTAAGWRVVRSDLHQMNFSAAAGPDDVRADVPESFDLQALQVAAVQSNGFAPDVAAEMAKLAASDLLILHFPLWWFSVPGLLKGWIDRVFAYGFAYGRGANFAGKAAMVVTSTGGPAASYTAEQRGTVEGFLRPVLDGTLGFCGFTVLPTFVAYGPARQTDEERSATRAAYIEHLTAHRPVTPN